MNFSFKPLMLGAIVLLTTFTACEEDEHQHDDTLPNTENLTLIASGYTDAGSMQVKLWAEGALEAKYTNFFVEVRDSATSELIDDAHVELMPMMDMGSMQHAAPYENPASADAVEGLFPCAVVFQMPGEMGWELTIHVHNHHSEGEGEVSFPLSVAAPTVARTSMVTGNNGTDKYIISYVQPSAPQVGMNTMEVTVHKKESMMSFPADTTLSIVMEPLMPSMGHGSPNNVNPTHTANGHYVGQVNFTMTGEWVVDFTLLNGTDTVVSLVSFDVTL